MLAGAPLDGLLGCTLFIDARSNAGSHQMARGATFLDDLVARHVPDAEAHVGGARRTHTEGGAEHVIVDGSHACGELLLVLLGDANHDHDAAATHSS